MKKIKVYCDTGGYNKVLEKYKNIELYGFEYENKNKRIKNKGIPSSNLTFDDFKEIEEISSKIIDIVGNKNKKDIAHLESAYKNKCHIFFTSDYDDIYSKKNLLESLLDIKIFLSQKNDTLEEFHKYMEKLNF